MRYLLLALTACVSTPRTYKLPEVAGQILVVEKGKPGLTTRACTKWKEPGMLDGLKGAAPECLEFESRSYDLADIATRKQLRELDFVCRFGDEYYQISAESPAICTRTYVKSCWLCQKKVVESCISQDEQDRLIGGKTVCYNRNLFSGVQK